MTEEVPKGQQVVIPYTPRRWQAEMHSKLKRFSVLVIHRGAGKDLALDTPIATPDGFTQMGDIQIGDVVYDRSGQPCNVTAVSETFNHECYEVEFCTGEKIICGGGHLWLTQDGNEESAKTTVEIAGSIEDGLQKNHRVRVVQAIQFPEQDLPIDPYVMGYWLGDGTSINAQVTDRDKSLRLLDVLQNKHIPTVYLRSSEAQRWRLLQGLMDSNGSVSKTGGKCEISLTNLRLTEDVRELTASLGLRPWNLVTSRAKIGIKDVGEKYRTGFKAYDEHPVFALARKQSRLPPRAKHNYQRNRMIVSVTPITSVPTRCIEVDSPDHTFCIGRSFIPTHNSVFAMNELLMRAARGPAWAEYVYLLPFRNQALRNVWVPLKRFCDPIPNVRYNNTSLEIVLPNNAKIMTLGADDPDKLRGLHLHGIVLDEFADMVPRTWMTVRPMLTNHSGWVLWIGTPRGRGPFWDKYCQSQEISRTTWYGEILPWWKTGALKVEEVEQMKSEMSTEEFAQEMECSFDAALVGAYYAKQLSELRASGRISAEPLYRDDLEVHTSWDLGIRDYMAVWFFQLVKDEIHFIDYIEESNWGFPEWSAALQVKARNNGYRYGTHIAPFDIKIRELGSGISRLESAEQCGIHFEQCPKQDPMDGIELVRRHLLRSRFQSIMCEDGLEALAMYRAKVDKSGQGLGPEHSVYSHACLVADTMVRTEHGDMRIADITDGIKVWTPCGLSEVLHSGLVKYVDRLIEIELSDGRQLRCSPEHKILTKRGFLAADMIRYDDIIISGEELSCRLISLISKVTGIGFRASITGETFNGIGVFVRTVAKSLCRRFLSAASGATRIVKLKHLELGEELPVYDLTIANHACYQANGILTSNSDSIRYGITYIVQVLQKPQFMRIPFIRVRR